MLAISIHPLFFSVFIATAFGVAIFILNLLEVRTSDAGAVSVMKHDTAVGKIRDAAWIQSSVGIVEPSLEVSYDASIESARPQDRAYIFNAEGPIMMPYFPERSPTWQVAGLASLHAGVSPL